MIEFIKRLQLKSDPKLIAFAISVAALAIALVLTGTLTPKEAFALLGTAFIFPGLLGEKNKPQSSDDEDGDDGSGGGGTPSGARMKAVVGEPAPSDPPKLDRAARVALVFVLLLVMTIGCTPGQRDGARSVLDVVQVACVVANAALPESKVAEICGVADDFFGPMRTLLAGTRAAAATRMNAGAVSTEARTPVVCASTNNGVECFEAPTR